MNFSKYAAALALFATAAYAASEQPNTNAEKPNTNAEKPTNAETAKVKKIDMEGPALVTAFNECKALHSDKASMISCLEGKDVHKLLAEKVCADFTTESELKEDEAKKAIDELNTEPEKTAAAGNWYDSINNVYGYTAGAVLAVVLIGGGVYMAMGRKSEDADL